MNRPEAVQQTRVLMPMGPEWPHDLKAATKIPLPERLFARGLPLRVNENAVAVVGTRNPTLAGIEAAEHLVRGLVEAEFVIVSGMANGIDTVAHRVALEMGGYTVGVAGCGLDIDYPRRNRVLRDKIATFGTLLSEHEDGVPPQPNYFPLRNRIIAALCRGTIFVEGTFKSGGLITARYAMDEGRDVFAVPGSFRNPMAAGPNELIRTSQAHLVTDVKQVFDVLAPGLAWDGPAEPLSLAKDVRLEEFEGRLLFLLDDVPTNVDELCHRLRADFGKVALALAKLEVRGLVRKRPMGYEITLSGARARGSVLDEGVG